MRIPCPYCGLRDAGEFSHLGDASAARPDTSSNNADVGMQMFEYVYLRDNPAGPIKEYWYHGFGCQSWLIVECDTRTHHILSTSMADAENAP